MSIFTARWAWCTLFGLAGALLAAIHFSQETKRRPDSESGFTARHAPLFSDSRSALAHHQDEPEHNQGTARSNSPEAPAAEIAQATSGSSSLAGSSSEAPHKPRSDTTVAAPQISGAMKAQFAAAIRDGQTMAIERLLEHQYGQDATLDGLLIDGAHRLHTVGTAAERRQARDALLKFGTHELNARSEAVPGNQIQIAEALGSIDDPMVVSHLIELTTSPDTDRVVKGSAVVALGELKAAEALPTIEAHLESLESELEHTTGDQRAFIASSLKEAHSVVEDLRRSN